MEGYRHAPVFLTQASTCVTHIYYSADAYQITTNQGVCPEQHPDPIRICPRLLDQLI